MRIVAGKYKGRILNMPKNNNVRPTSEKVKESIFSSIMNYTFDSICCDMFSGTGNLGLEALSRGAKYCYFSDNSRESIELLKSNINMVKANEDCSIYFGDYKNNLLKIKGSNTKIDIFFIDPPYKKGLYDDVMKLIKEYELLNEDGILVLEHSNEDIFPDYYFDFNKFKEKHFGNVCFTIYR